MGVYQMTYQLKVRYKMSSGVPMDSASSLGIATRHTSLSLSGPYVERFEVVDHQVCDCTLTSHTPLLHECVCMVLVTMQGETDSPEFTGGVLAGDTYVSHLGGRRVRRAHVQGARDRTTMGRCTVVHLICMVFSRRRHDA